jgi:type IV secretion system protein VirD4
MGLVRMIFNLALVVLAYTLVVLTLRFMCLAACFALLLVASGVWRKTVPLWAMGTARWAEPDDLAGMLDRDTGLGVGRLAYKPAGVLKAAAELFDRSLKPEAACEQFVRAFLRSGNYRLDGPVVRLSRAVHTAVFAPTGAGKGVSCVIPFLLECRASVVCLDYKGENYRITANHRKEKFGHKIVVLDPFKVVTQTPDTFNALDFIDETSPVAIDEVRDLAAAMVVRTGREPEAHWNDSAETWITAITCAVVFLTTPPNRSLQAVRTLLTNPTAMEAAIQSMCGSNAGGEMLSRLGFQLRHYRERELGSVLTTTNRHLNFLDSVPVAENTRTSSFDPAELNRGTTTIYLVLPPDHMRKQAALLRLWLTALLRAVVKGGLQDANKVHFVCDEAASLMHMDCLAEAVDKYRGYGVRLQLYYQSMGQLKECWPNGRELTVLSNTTQIFFGVNDQETAEYVSARLGEQTIVVESGGENQGSSVSFTGGVSSGSSVERGRSRNFAQQARRLLKPEEVTALPPRAAVTLTPGVPPIATMLTRYYERPESRRSERLWAVLGTTLAAFALLALSLWLARAVTVAENPAGVPNGSVPRRAQGR